MNLRATRCGIATPEGTEQVNKRVTNLTSLYLRKINIRLLYNSCC